MSLSVKDALGDSTLLTGGLGFLGSVCLEQLLARTSVRAVYLLVRSKRGVSAQQRVHKLLCGPLFQQLHQQVAEGGPNVFNKVRVVEGDMDLPGLGLSDADRRELLQEVQVVIHGAASLTLDAHIQDALKCNFAATRTLLQLASEMRCLRAFVHVSTFFVSNFKPVNTPVKEEVHYPTLQLAGDPQHLTAVELAEYLLAADPDTAAAEAAKLMQRLNFISTYAFSKLLTEQVVDDPATLPGVSKVIIRPSLISPMADQPYPGYFAGYAGSPGYTLGYGMGCFHDIHSVAFSSDAAVDLIPVDVTASLIIAAAAAASANGPYGPGRARVYHSASAHSYPVLAPQVFAMLNKFWTCNPPPFRLPFTRYPTYSGRHHPTPASMWLGSLMTQAKVWAGAALLRWMGKSRQANSLINGFKAFCVQNTPGYARSIVSCVDNVRELEASIVASERDMWQCVWDERTGTTWEQYFWTGLTGLRSIGLKLPECSVVGVPHGFAIRHGLSDRDIMTHWMSEAPTSDSGSTGISNSSGSSTAGSLSSASSGSLDSECAPVRVSVPASPQKGSTRVEGLPTEAAAATVAG